MHLPIRPLQLQPLFSAPRFLHAPDYWMRQGEKSEKNKGIPQHSNRSRSRILLMINRRPLLIHKNY